MDMHAHTDNQQTHTLTKMAVVFYFVTLHITGGIRSGTTDGNELLATSGTIEVLCIVPVQYTIK